MSGVFYSSDILSDFNSIGCSFNFNSKLNSDRRKREPQNYDSNDFDQIFCLNMLPLRSQINRIGERLSKKKKKRMIWLL